MQYRCLISLFIAHRKATTYSFSKVMPKVHFAKKYFHDLFTGNSVNRKWGYLREASYLLLCFV